MKIALKNNKFIKKFVGLLCISIVAVALGSCDDSRNTTVPMSSNEIDFSSTYASASTDVGTESCTYEEVYNMFRSDGYDTVLSELKKAVVQDEMDEATYDTNMEAYNEDILAAVYGSSDLDSFKDLSDSDIEDFEDTVDDYVTDEYDTYGLDLSSDTDFFYDLIDELGDYDSLDVSISWPDELIDQYCYSVAIVNLAREYLETVCDDEDVYSYEDEDEISNTYYIDDDDIEDEYISTYYEYNKTQAIVVKFNSKAEAYEYLDSTTDDDGYNLDNGDALDWYKNLYNSYNNDDEQLQSGSEFDDDLEDKTVFYYDDDNTDLSSDYSSDLEDFIYDNMEDGSYLSTPRNIDGSYYLVYRDSVQYYYGDGSSEDYDDVCDKTIDNLGNEITDYNGDNVTLKQYIKSEIIDGDATTTLGNTLVLDRLLYCSTIEIYDPVFENQFYNSYEDEYDLTDNFNSYLIFSVTFTDDNFTPEDTSDDTTHDTVEYSVDDFFETMDAIEGAEDATTLLEYDYVLDSDLHYLITDDDTDDYEDSAEDIISDFKSNDTSYSKKMGVANYLALTYGITVDDSAKDALTDYLYAEALIDQFESYYGYFVGDLNTDGSTFTDDNDLFTNLASFAESEYEDYYDLYINQIIIEVCPDTMGTSVDPSLYIKELEEQDEENEAEGIDSHLASTFEDGVYFLAELIYAELDTITADSTDAMATLVQTFNNAGYTYELQSDFADDNNIKTWADFKEKYDFDYYLYTEDLDEVTNSTAEDYVDSFQDYLENIVGEIEDSDTIQDTIDDDGAYLFEEDSYSDLCMTEYGYHILNVYEYDEGDSCEFTEDDDTTVSNSSYMKWQHLELTVADLDEDSTLDDMVVYVTGYSDNEYPSAEQCFIYFYESQTDDGVTSMKSSISSAVETYFEDVMDRYTSSTFQAYRLLQQVFGFDNYDSDEQTFTSITFYDYNGDEDTDKATAFKNYVTELRVACDDGDELDEDSVFSGWFDVDWTSDLSNCYYYYYDDDDY